MQELRIEKKEDLALVVLQKEKLDSIVAPVLKSELVVLNNEGFKNILLDLSNTKYCDSSGLSSILVGNRLCKNAGGKFILCNLNETIQKLISISQLDSILTISDSVEEGLEKLA